MVKAISIDRNEIFKHIQLSCQLPTFIEGAIHCKIIASTAAAQGITVTLAELQQAADSFRLANQLYESNDTWLWLEKHHLNLDDFEELVCTNALSSKLAQHLFGKQVEPFFYEHQLDYVGAAVYEVVLPDEDLAIELFYAVQEGETSFHEVARQYIQEPALRRSAGYRGILRRSDLKPEISAAVFAATPPQILKPIATSKDVHLILVEEIIQPELNDQLHTQILADLFSAWLKQQTEQIEVDIHLEDSPPKDLTVSTHSKPIMTIDPR
ncbi:peptidylprolyl isomerase [Oculatella sp. LEGE 06141]|uniref:peptidylprolyl isomerase n=1 Tax=Oculatella sp. LEGE 06141 TaxID=1828648 RepID=UPI001881AC12|nr:peptidylprolyl isomerase [Oculatella sp. LEGE 06141]MBE9181631.1 peptidylprolyl isomerase [Oculatella sp. LEGE 06141]